MAKKSKAQSAGNKDTQTVNNVPERQVTDKAAIIERAIQNMEKKIASDDVKGSIADFIRLLQLQKEYYGDEPRQVVVRWIESTETEPVSET